MTTSKERFDTSFGKVLPQMGVEPSQISSLLSFFRQELLALAEEVEILISKRDKIYYGLSDAATIIRNRARELE